MYRRLKLYVATGVLALIVIGVSAIALFPEEARVEGLAQTIAADLRNAGLNIDDVLFEGETVVVRIPSKEGGDPADPWARTLIERRLSSLRQEGRLNEAEFAVRAVGSSGNVIYTAGGPIEEIGQPSPGSATSVDAQGLQEPMRDMATQQGVDLRALEAAEVPGQGTLLRLTLAVNEADSASQIKWIIMGLLPSLRERAERDLGLGVDLYRLTILGSESGAPLVDYVVDVARAGVKAWMADGIEPVWSLSGPSTGSHPYAP